MFKSEIKVLHLIGLDMNTGAARGAYTLHRSLLFQGVHSRILTDSRTDPIDETVILVAKDRKTKMGRALRRFIDEAPSRLYRNRKKRRVNPESIRLNPKIKSNLAPTKRINGNWVKKIAMALKICSFVSYKYNLIVRKYALDCLLYRITLQVT